MALRCDRGATEYGGRWAEPGCPWRWVYTGSTVPQSEREGER